jgi:hypothetical protein
MGDDQISRTLLRHTLATVAYRGSKALRDAPPEFGGFRLQQGSRTPGEILAHMGDLFDWALLLAKGTEAWHDTPPQAWDRDVDRFFVGLGAFDAYLESDAPLGFPAERLLQGPVADALTHVGQIAMLRRLAGAPLRGESYFKAKIAVGRVGIDQQAPRVEFD